MEANQLSSADGGKPVVFRLLRQKKIVFYRLRQTSCLPPIKAHSCFLQIEAKGYSDSLGNTPTFLVEISKSVLEQDYFFFKLLYHDCYALRSKQGYLLK